MHRYTKSRPIHRILNKPYHHILVDTLATWSHQPPSRYTLNRTLSWRPVSCCQWKSRKNNYQEPMSHHREYCVALDYGVSGQITAPFFPIRI